MLIPGGRQGVYVPTGHILYTADGGLFAVAFDLAQRRVLGAPVRMLERVGATLLSRGYSVSATGVLVQHDAPGSGGVGTNRVVIVDPARGADTVRMPPGRRAYPRFSPDGKSMAMEVFADGRAGATDIYTLDLLNGTYTQLTFDGDNNAPVWSPDGKRIVFSKRDTDPSGSGEDLFVKPADNSAPERRLTTLGSLAARPHQWIDEKTVLFDAVVVGRANDVFTVAADSGSAPVPYLPSPFSEVEPWLSPDRKLLAFTSNETSGPQVWMRDFPVPQGKWNISHGPGSAARWSPDGRFVYFWRSAVGPFSLDTLLRARVDRTPAVVVQAPEVVATINADGVQHWDLHPDGRRFIVAVISSEPAATSASAPQARYLILLNWFDELRRQTGATPK
jgi:serine/threonine-protein kinase